jgi:hypothetical protein
MNSILRLKELLASENLKASIPATESDISTFVEAAGMILPEDLIDYFKILNGTSGEYDERFFAFYSLQEFVNLNDKFRDWNGIPKYKDILVSFENASNCYVFADYQFHLFTYAIQLDTIGGIKNEVYAICGGEFRVIANSFSHFIDRYLDDSDDLQF